MRNKSLGSLVVVQPNTETSNIKGEVSVCSTYHYREHTSLIMGNSISTLKVPKLRFLHAILVCVLLAHTVDSKRFDGDTCKQFLLNSPSNTSYLLPGSSPDLLRISYGSCLVACGDKTGRFNPLLPRLNTWLFPVLFLLANAQFPTAAGSDRPRRNLFKRAVAGLEVLSHIIGDPVDYAFTLLSQVETWRECRELATELRGPPEGDDSRGYEAQIQNAAVILAAFERVLDHLGDRGNAGTYFSSIFDTLKTPTSKMTREDWTTAIKYESKIARNFVIVRTRHLAPAIVAIAFYAWQIVGAFVPAVGASPNPSGGRVAVALTLSWIVFMVLFGSTVGGPASDTAYADTIDKFLKRRPLKFGQQRRLLGSPTRVEINEAGETY
jgi:hypothetical protein